MRLVRLEAHNFAQHADLDLDLAGVREAAIVGDNGAGKSKLMEAAVWSLYGRPIRGSVDSKIRTGQQGMWVRSTWDKDGATVIVLRTRSTETKAGESSLALEVDGVRQSKHTIAETQAEIERLAGLTRDEVLAGPWMAQGRSADLMELRPAPRKALVNSLFQLDVMERYHERATKLRRDLAQTLERGRGQLEVVEAQAAEKERAAALLDAAVRELALADAALIGATRKVEELRAEATRLREEAAEANQLGTTIKDRQAELDRVTAEIAHLERRIASAEDIVSKPVQEPAYADVADVAPSELGGLEDRARSLEMGRQQVASANLQLRHALEVAEAAEEKGLCDVCPYRGEAVDIDAVHRRLAAAEQVVLQYFGADADLATAKVEYETAVERRRLALAENDTKRDAFDRALQVRELMVGERDQAVLQLTGAKDRSDALGAAIATANKEYLRLIQSQDRALEVVAESETAGAQLAAADQRMRIATQNEARARQVHDLTVAAELDVMRLRTVIAEQEERDRLLGIVVRMFHRDGLPTVILERGLPVIEDRANEVLGRMPGAIALRFVTQKLTKADTWSDELDIEVIEDGVDRPYDEMSGAERFRIDLALRLGIQTVLQRRHGSSWETLWLDEPFSAQRRGEALEMVLQAISSVTSEFGLTLLTTHEPEVADRIPVRIELQEASGIATARVA